MTPLKVLIVEDEAAIAFMVEEAVEAAGHKVAFVASNITDAMRIAVSGSFDAALLDVNLNGQRAHALPVTLSARKIPFAFITGYGEVGLLQQFKTAPVIAKPFRYADVAAALDRLSGQTPPA